MATERPGDWCISSRRGIPEIGAVFRAQAWGGSTSGLPVIRPELRRAAGKTLPHADFSLLIPACPRQTSICSRSNWRLEFELRIIIPLEINCPGAPDVRLFPKNDMSGDVHTPETSSRRYAAVLRISEAISACSDPQELATILADQLIDFLSFDHLDVMVLQGEFHRNRMARVGQRSTAPFRGSADRRTAKMARLQHPGTASHAGTGTPRNVFRG